MTKTILLADKDSYGWEFAEKIQRHIKEKGLELDLEEVSVTNFRNGEMNLSGMNNVRGKDVYYVADTSKSPSEWWTELLLVKDMLLNASVKSLSFVLSDMFYSRQDRKAEPRVPISARALANSISQGIQRIITMDLHSAQIQGFYPANVPVDNLYSFPEVVQHLVKNYEKELKDLVILSPDAGGVDRAKAFMRRLSKVTPENEYEIGFMIKHRPKAGEVGEIKYIGPEFKGKHVLVVDDMIDSGGTLCKSGAELKKGGAKSIACYATHGLFTKGTDELAGIFDSIFTSNTHKLEDDNLKIIDMSPTFAEAIYRAEMNESISEIFE